MSVDELLARIARLGARDRSWLLGELPPTTRRRLLQWLSDGSAPDPVDQAVASPQGWEAIDPIHLASLMAAEPAWLISAATRSTDSHWRERLLQSLGTRRRHEIELADRTGALMGPKAVSLILDECRRRVGSLDPSAASLPRAGFAALLEQMKGRFA